MIKNTLLLILAILSVTYSDIFFQAHRGAVDEAPENTLAALNHAWSVPGAVPEVDLRTTKDGVIICLHDTSLSNTTNASTEIKDKNISLIEFNSIKNLDAGSHFHTKFTNERVPTLDQVFALMLEFENAQIYLDVKDVDYYKLKEFLIKYDIEQRIIFVHGNQDSLISLKKLFPQARTMTWLSGESYEIKQKYSVLEKSVFAGIDQLQFHLKVKENGKQIEYVLDKNFLLNAKKSLDNLEKTMQLRPFEFTPISMKKLLNLGIEWYVTDAPQHFYETIQEAQKIN